MRIIYISGLYPAEIIKKIESDSKSFIHYGPNKLQQIFATGLKEFFNNVVVITSPLIGTYPKSYKKVFFKSYKFITNNSTLYSVATIRLPIFDLFSKCITIFIRLNKIVKETNNFNYIIIYSPHFPYILASLVCKYFNKNVKICVYINDLPEYMSSNKNIVYLTLKKIEKSLFKLFLKKFDSYILVTKNLANKLSIVDKPWICIEGIYNENNNLLSTGKFNYLKKDGDSILLYTGSLDRRYGINDLINSFLLINDPNIKLWICGFGEMKDEIIKISKENKQIFYLGQLTHEEVISLQQLANILINPRKPFDDFTKYSFPIKTLEYLASGIPTIMYQLPGIPQEYYEHFFTPDGFTNIDLKNSILRVLKYPQKDLLNKVSAAKNFILKNNSIKTQFSKLTNIIS